MTVIIVMNRLRVRETADRYDGLARANMAQHGTTFKTVYRSKYIVTNLGEIAIICVELNTKHPERF